MSRWKALRKERDAAVDSGNRKIKYIRGGGKKPQERTDDGSGRCVEGARIWIGGVENRVLVRKAASPRWSGMDQRSSLNAFSALRHKPYGYGSATVLTLMESR